MTASLSAQNLGGGLILGANISQVDGDSNGGFNKIGAVVGGFARYQLIAGLYLQPEIMFEMLGSANKFGLIVDTRHVSIPILLNAAIPISLGATEEPLQFHAGLIVGVLLSAEDINDIDVSGVLDKADYRVAGGVEFKFSPRWGLNLRYGYSLASFLKDDGPSLGVNLLAPGQVGLAHHYISATLRWHLARP